MKAFIFSFFLLLTLLITACDQEKMLLNNPNDNNKTSKPFNLEKVKQQYADVPLKIIDISEQDYNNGKALAVTLSTPLNPKNDFQSFFRVSNEKGQLFSGSWILSESGLVVYFPDIEPASDYIVDVVAGLSSATQAKLETAQTKKIKTRDMQPQLRFASKGSVLPAQLAKGLPVITTNIQAADVNFHRIKANKVTEFLSQWKNRQQQQAYQLKKYMPLADLVYTGRFDLKAPKNTRHTTHLDLAAIKPLQQAGVYLAVMKQAGNYDYEHQVTYFVVTDLGIHARMFSNKMSVMVSSLSSGQAVQNVEVSLLDKKDQVIEKQMTNAEGQINFNQPAHKAQLLIAKNLNNLSILPLNTPALDLSEFKITGREQKPIEIFVYAGRDIYRPGELVQFNAILRDFDAQKINTPPLNAVIKRPDGQKIKYFTWHPQQAGYYQTEYQLASNAMTGNWILELESGDKVYHQYKFKVDAFLPERMELLVGQQPPQDLWTDATSNIEIPISGQYLYGAPAAGNRLSSKLVIKTQRHPLEKFKEYYFGLEDEKPPVEYRELNDIQLDKQGLATRYVTSQWQSVKNTPLNIKVINSLFETGGRTVTRSINVTSWPQKHLIGIRPQFKLDSIPANSDLSFELIKSDAQGKLNAEGEILVSLIREQRNYYWEYSDYQGWHSEYTQKNYSVFEKRLQLDATKAIPLEVPVEWGSYLLVIKDVTTGQSSSLRFYAGTSWYDEDNTQAARPERVVLALDKKAYRTGETLKLKITPPYAGEGFVAVENGQQQLWFQRVNVPAQGMNLDIPIPPEWKQHDIYISTVIFKAGSMIDKITPNRAVGLIHLPLDRSSRQLEVSLNTPTPSIRPETTLSTTVTVKNASAGQKNYITLAAVDVGVLNITNFKTPDPYQWFFEPRRYSVDQRDMYHQIIALTDGGVTRARFGGDADEHAGGTRPDSNIKIVSLFSGLVETDAEGKAIIDLFIPDFNGRLRLMAVAFNDNQYGAADAEVTVVAPVIAEMSLPRFLAAGDESVLTLDLRNQSGEKQQLELNIQVSDPVQLTTKLSSQQIVLEDQQKQVLHLPVRAGNAFGQSNVQLQLNNAPEASEKIALQREWFIGVRPAYPAEFKVTRKVISKNATVKIHPDLNALLLNSATSQLSISSRPPINLKQHLKSLLQYPYGCLEQTISSTYPWLAVNPDNLSALGLDDLKIQHKKLNLADKDKHIQHSLSRLAGMQRSNGSFGLWSNNDNEEHWLTAYTVDFLLDAKQQGINVPTIMLDKALKRLQEYLNHRGQMYNQGYSEYPLHYSFAYKAYSAYVLSRVNRAPLGSLRTLFDLYQKQVQAALPFVHLGLALYNQGDTIRGEKSIMESLHRPRTDFLYLGDYGSRLRDLAQMTYLLTQHPTTQKSGQKLLFQLADELSYRQYLSTQEQNALFRVGLSFQKLPQQAWEAKLSLDKQQQPLQQSKTYQQRFTGNEIPKNIQLSSQSEQVLFLQHSLQGYPKKAPVTKMDVIQVERNYYTLTGQSIKPERIKTGDVLVVHLNITAQKRIKDALVIDLIPAGLELESQNLEHVIRIEDFKILGKSILEMQQYNTLKYQEYLDDRYIAALDLHEKQPQHVFYLARAVTKGKYTNPPPYVEDMYRPYIKAIGRTFADIEVF